MAFCWQAKSVREISLSVSINAIFKEVNLWGIESIVDENFQELVTASATFQAFVQYIFTCCLSACSVHQVDIQQTKSWLLINCLWCVWLSTSRTMLSQSRFTSQPTFQPLFGVGLEVAQTLRGGVVEEQDQCVWMDVFTWKEAEAIKGREPVKCLIVFHLGCSRRKQKAGPKLGNRWWSIDEWKESKHSLVNKVGCIQESKVSATDFNTSLFLPWVDAAPYVPEFSNALWVLSSVRAIREIFTDLWLSCFVRRHCIEVISSFMLSSSEGYGSLIQHATSFLPAGWATGPSVFYHHGALGLCSPNLSTRAANMTNWCGASIVSHTSTLADCVSGEVPVFVHKTKPFYCTGGYWSEVFVLQPLFLLLV